MAGMRVARRALIATGAALGFVLLMASPAFAHATLVAESPPPGVGLAQAPGAVVLKFTEPLNRRLSRIRIIDHTGRDAGKGPTLAVVGDPKAMQRKVGFLSPGTYTVDWTSVSTLDGHTIKGSYRFGVGAAPGSGETAHSNPVASEGWLGLAGTFGAFIGLALWAGAVVLGARATRAGLTRSRVASIRRTGTALAFVGVIMSALSSAAVASGSPWRIGDVLLGSSAGYWRLAVIGAGFVALLLDRLARMHRLDAVVDGSLAVVAIVGLSASGHAAATPVPAWATLSLTIHVLAIGVWIFALTAALLTTNRVASLRALSPYAIGAAVLVAATGIGNSVLELHNVGDLVTTTYGKVLLGKIIAILVMAAFGVAHYRSRDARDPPVRRIRDLVAGELGTAVIAFVLATVLVGFPSPPREEAATEAAENAGGASLTLVDTRPAASVASADGPFILGLSVLPPRPGSVTFRLDVIGEQPGDALRDVSVSATSADGRSLRFALHGCGTACFQGSGVIPTAGQWRLVTELMSNRGPLRTETALPIPTPDATAILDHALDTMSGLRSLEIDEQLRSAANQPPQLATYLFGAPDRFSYSIVGGGAQIHIGQQQFLRDTAAGPWTVSPPAPAGIDTTFYWPDDYFREVWGHAAAVRLIGHQTIDGVPTDVVSFVRTDVTAWFRLWIDARGLVHREEMRAEGHIMDHRYVAYDHAPTIEPPR